MTLKLKALGLGLLLSAGLMAAAPASAQTTLKVWIPGVGLDQYMNEVLKPAFEAANPDITLEPTELSWTSYQQKILTGVAAGDGPDVIGFYVVDTAPWAAQGVLAELDGKFDPSLFINGALDNGSWNGKQYGIPIGLQMRPLFYRKDFVAEAGLDGPPETWEEMAEYARKLVKKDSAGNIERVGFWVPTNHPYKTVQVWLTFFWDAGGELFNEDGTKAAFNSPAGVEATQFLADFINKDKVDVPGAIKIDNTDFAQGRVAMLVSNIVTRDLMEKTPELKDVVGIAMVPANKEQYVELAGAVLGVSATSKNQDAAMKLINFILTNPDIAAKYCAIDQTIPAIKSLVDSEYVNNNPWIPTYLGFVDHAHALPAHPKWTEISAIITKALDSVYLEGASAKEALDSAAAAADEVLAR